MFQDYKRILEALDIPKGDISEIDSSLRKGEFPRDVLDTLIEAEERGVEMSFGSGELDMRVHRCIFDGLFSLGLNGSRVMGDLVSQCSERYGCKIPKIAQEPMHRVDFIAYALQAYAYLRNLEAQATA